MDGAACEVKSYWAINNARPNSKQTFFDMTVEDCESFPLDAVCLSLSRSLHLRLRLSLSVCFVCV